MPKGLLTMSTKEIDRGGSADAPEIVQPCPIESNPTGLWRVWKHRLQ